jgi:hypothetical protein
MMARWPLAVNTRAMAAPKPALAPVMKTIMMSPWMKVGVGLGGLAQRYRPSRRKIVA